MTIIIDNTMFDISVSPIIKDNTDNIKIRIIIKTLFYHNESYKNKN